jgi:iron complex transport system substrate-binding protein
VLLLATLVMAGCRRDTPPARPASAALRVVSLAPNITEIVDAIGAGSQLVGRSSACDYPADLVKRVPVVGDFGVPSLERLLTVSPDLVLYADLADKALAGRLERAELRSARVRCTRLEEIPPAIRLVGILLHRELPAKALAADLERSFRETRATLPPPDQRPSCLVLIWHDPLTAAGRNSFVSDLVSLAGGRNIGDEIDRDYFQVSGEWVLARDPDIILCFVMAGQTPVRELLARQPGWDRLKAMRTHRVFAEFDNNLVLRPGPRVLEGLAGIKAALAAPVVPPVP